MICRSFSLQEKDMKAYWNPENIVTSFYFDWLEKKSLIEYVVIDGKTHVTLTEAGREFAKPLVTLSV